MSDALFLIDPSSAVRICARLIKLWFRI